MLRRVIVGTSLMLAGCGLAEADFVVSYTAALCEHTMACSDQAELTFEGVLTQDDCVIARERSVAEWGVGCRYRPADADQCLADMQALTCPAAEGELADIPTSCNGVYVDCSTVATEDQSTAE